MDTQAAVAHHWEDALLTFETVLSLVDTVEHLLEKSWLPDVNLQLHFAPALDAFVNNNEIRLWCVGRNLCFF